MLLSIICKKFQAVALTLKLAFHTCIIRNPACVKNQNDFKYSDHTYGNRAGLVNWMHQRITPCSN